MSFLDAFQGYHQIALAAKDQEKMAFISPYANYHYTVMPFKLKNVRATYHRMMTRMFQDKIGRTVEVYIDDMVVKSKQETRHIKDLQGVFKVLQQHKLRLNAEKCAFEVGAGKFLGYLIKSWDRGQSRPDWGRIVPQAAGQSKRSTSVNWDVSCP